MKLHELKLGQRVRARVKFRDVPAGTEGVIDEVHSHEHESLPAWMVAWDLPERPLPASYWAYKHRPSGFHPRRDGFISSELRYLEAVTA